MQRTALVCDQIDAILKDTAGVKHYTVVIGATTTNSASYFLTLDLWDERDRRGRTADVIIADLNHRFMDADGPTAYGTGRHRRGSRHNSRDVTPPESVLDRTRAPRQIASWCAGPIGLSSLPRGRGAQ